MLARRGRLLAEPVGLLQSRLQFLLDGERNIECNRTYRFHQQFADGLIDTRSGNPLAEGLGMLDPFTLAHIGCAT